MARPRPAPARTTRAFARAEREVALGRRWKAIDHLRGLLVDRPEDQELLGRIGELYYEMGELPEAGRYWWLTERDDEAGKAAVAAFHERYGRNPRAILAALARPTRPDLYPPSVRSRLEALVATIPMPRQRFRGTPDTLQRSGERPKARRRLLTAAFLLIAAVLVAIFGAGLATVVGWIAGPR